MSPKLSESAGEPEFLYKVMFGPELASASVETIVKTSELSATVIVIPADEVIAPSTCNVEAMSTAPSISTTSKFAVPLTSIAPSRSISPFTIKSSVTVRSSCTFRSTTLRLANASTTAAPLPAPSK